MKLINAKANRQDRTWGIFFEGFIIISVTNFKANVVGAICEK